MGDAAKKIMGGVALLSADEIHEIVSQAVREALAAHKANDGYLDTEQAAAYLGTTAAAIRASVARGSLVPDHRGQRGGGMKGNRFTRTTLDAWVSRKHIVR